MKDSRYSDLPKGYYPSLPPAKGGIFLREVNKEAVSLVVWNHVFEATHQLPSEAIPNERAFISLAQVVYVWKDGMWYEDKEAKHHIDRCVQAGNFSVLDFNFIDVTDPSEEAGITFGCKDRRNWTLGNWIAHLGGRINKDGYLEFGSVYAFNTMLKQMLRADFKGKDGEMRITIDGGDDAMKVAVASLMAGVLSNADYTPGQNLSALIEKVNARSVDLNAVKEQICNAAGDTEIVIDVLPSSRG